MLDKGEGGSDIRLIMLDVVYVRPLAYSLLLNRYLSKFPNTYFILQQSLEHSPVTFVRNHIKRKV